MSGRAMELEAEVCCPSNVPQYPFDELKMSISWGVHEEADLLDCICKVRPGQCEVLECARKAAVKRGVVKWCTGGEGNFGGGVDRGGNRVAIEHSGSVKYLQGVLVLIKEKTMFVASHGDAKEVVNVTKVCHREFSIKRCDDGG
jgi:hypothetical protein